MKRWILKFFLFFTLFHSLAHAGLIIGGEYLYWNILQSGMSYAEIVESIETHSNSRMISQKQDWGSGYRITAGYDFSSFFDWSISWTHFHNRIKGKITRPTIIATQLDHQAIGGTGIGGSASSKWNLQMDLYDLNFGCMAFDSCLFVIHPKIGIRGGSINQKQFVRYNDFFDIDQALFFTATVKQKNNTSWCIGPKIGLDNAYKLGCGLSFICDLAATFLYGQLNTNILTDFSVNRDIDSSFRDTRFQIFPNFQLFLGLNWDKSFGHAFDTSLGIGYEVHYFWNTWRITNFSQNSIAANAGFGDLMMHGLTAKLFIGF